MALGAALVPDNRRVQMRNRIFGTLAVVWGGFIVLNYAVGGGAGQGDEAYEMGQFVGLVLGAALLVFGVRALVNRRR